MTDQTGSPRTPRLDALGANHILAAAARMIHRWHGDPNLDCQAEAQKIIDESAKVHFALVEIGQQSEAQSLSGEREGIDVERLYRAVESVTEEWDDQNDEPSVIFAGSQYDLCTRIAAEYRASLPTEGGEHDG